MWDRPHDGVFDVTSATPDGEYAMISVFREWRRACGRSVQNLATGDVREVAAFIQGTVTVAKRTFVDVKRCRKNAD